MLCEQNDDINNYILLRQKGMVHARKLTRHRLAVASMQRTLRQGNSLAFWKQRSESGGDWCNGKGIQSAYFWYDSDISKCKQSLFARYCTPSTLLAFKFCQMLH